MNTLEELATNAQQRALFYKKCSPQQALVYACEDIVENIVGSPQLKSQDAQAWLEQVCQIEDIDTPHVDIHRASSTLLASTVSEHNAICLRGSLTTRSTLLHELAHLMSDGHSHGVLFRDELVRLTRAHLSVDYAATLHGLYKATGLDMSPWPASAQRR